MSSRSPSPTRRSTTTTPMACSISPCTRRGHSFARDDTPSHTRKGGYTDKTEQAREIRHWAILGWVQALYYNSGLFSEVLIYLTAQSAPNVVAGSVVSWTSLRPLTVIL